MKRYLAIFGFVFIGVIAGLIVRGIPIVLQVNAGGGIQTDRNGDVNGDARLLVGIVPEGFTSEVSLSEIEIHAMPSPGQAAASMRLDADEANHTAADGTWWSFIWIDVGPRGLFSAHDAYYVRTNSTADFTVAFYDLWADAWTDQLL